MIDQLARGMNIYYRGFIIHEDIRHIHYTIYGVRPHRREMTCVGDSREAMRWIDRQIAAAPEDNPAGWPSLFPGSALQRTNSLIPASPDPREDEPLRS